MSADVAAAGSPPPRAVADVGKGTKPDGGVKAAAVRAGSGEAVESINTYVILDEWNNQLDTGRIVANPQEHIYLVDIHTQDIQQIQPAGSVPQPVLETIVHTELASSEQAAVSLMCAICNSEHKNLAALKRHQKYKHGGKIKCDECDYQAAQNYDLKRHKEAKHSCPSFACDECDYVATLAAGLKTHKRVKHIGQTFACDMCNFSSAYSSALQRHIRKHRLRLECNVEDCDYSTNRKDLLKEHVQTKHQNVKFYCQNCDFAGASHSSLRNHQEAVHKMIRYKCDACEFVSARKHNLLSHIKSKHNRQDKTGPKKPLSAFLRYCGAHTKSLQHQQPWLTKVERRQVLRQMWLQLTKTEQAKYHHAYVTKDEKEQEDKEDTDKMEASKERGILHIYPATLEERVSMTEQEQEQQRQGDVDDASCSVLSEQNDGNQPTSQINQRHPRSDNTVKAKVLPALTTTNPVYAVAVPAASNPVYAAVAAPGAYNSAYAAAAASGEQPTYVYVDENGDFINVFTEAASQVDGETSSFISLPTLQPPPPPPPTVPAPPAHPAPEQDPSPSLGLPPKIGKALDASPRRTSSSQAPLGSTPTIQPKQQRLFPCDECGYTAKHAHHLKSHKMARHDPTWIHCSRCTYKAKRPDLLRRHLLSVHENIRYKCNHCDHLTPDLTSLRKHVQSMHLGQMFPCDLCGQQFKHKSTRMRHIKSVHRAGRTAEKSAEPVPKNKTSQKTKPVINKMEPTINTGNKMGPTINTGNEMTPAINTGNKIGPTKMTDKTELVVSAIIKENSAAPHMAKAVKTEKTACKSKQPETTTVTAGLKRPPSKYLLFCQDERVKILAEKSDLSITEVGQELGRRWRSLEADQRKLYEQRYAQSMLLYKEQQTLLNPPDNEKSDIKPPLSPFFLYLNQERDKVRSERPGINIKEEVAIVARRWSKLPIEEKDKFSAAYNYAYRKYKIDKSNRERLAAGEQELEPSLVQRVLYPNSVLKAKDEEKIEKVAGEKVDQPLDSALSLARRIIRPTHL